MSGRVSLSAVNQQAVAGFGTLTKKTESQQALILELGRAVQEVEDENKQLRGEMAGLLEALNTLKLEFEQFLQQ